MKSKLPYFLLIIPVLVIVGMVAIFVADEQSEQPSTEVAEINIQAMDSGDAQPTQAKSAQQAVQTQAAEQVTLRLEGIVAAKEPADSTALISVDALSALSYREGQALDGVAAFLKKIELKSVIVEHTGGRLERLYVAKKEKPQMTEEEYIEALMKRLQQS